MVHIPEELFEIEMCGNTEIRRYVAHWERMGFVNFIEEWYYDQTEIYLQEMLLNFKHQFAILGLGEQQ